MEYTYLDKLDINYFKGRIQEQITHIEEEGFHPDYSIEILQNLRTATFGLRTYFFIFSITGIEELIKPIDERIAHYKSLLENEDIIDDEDDMNDEENLDDNNLRLHKLKVKQTN